MNCDIWKLKKLPLPDVLSFIVDNRGKTVPTVDKGHILIATNCVKNESLYPVYEKVRYLNDETYNNWFRSHPIPGDILFVCKGTPGRVCLVPDPINFCIAQDMVALRTNNEIIYNKYLFAVLRSYEIQQQIKQTSVGDVIPHFKKSFFEQIEIPIPDMRIQHIIGDFYFNFSNKIELNNKINENLEAQAQAIFKSWFIDFEPFGGVMPSDWKEIKLKDIANFINGYSYTGKELINSNCAMATIKNFERNGGFKVNGFKEINPLKKIKEEQYLNVGDILVAHTDLTQNADIIGNAEQIISNNGYEKLIYSMDLVKVVSKSECVSNNLLYMLLHNKNFKNHCLNYINGTTVLHLSKKALDDYSFNFPSNMETINKLENIFKSVIDKEMLIQKENERLIELRDTLLPKLMSGEIDVSKVEI